MEKGAIYDARLLPVVVAGQVSMDFQASVITSGIAEVAPAQVGQRTRLSLSSTDK